MWFWFLLNGFDWRCEFLQCFLTFTPLNQCAFGNGSYNKRMSLSFFACFLFFWCFLIDNANFVQTGHFSGFKNRFMYAYQLWLMRRFYPSLTRWLALRSLMHMSTKTQKNSYCKILTFQRVDYYLGSIEGIQRDSSPHISFLVSNVVSNLANNSVGI